MINLVNLAVKNFEVASNFCHLNVFRQPCFEVCALINNYVLTVTLKWLQFITNLRNLKQILEVVCQKCCKRRGFLWWKCWLNLTSSSCMQLCFFFAVKNFERKRNVMYVQVYHWQKWHFFIFFITAKSDV